MRKDSPQFLVLLTTAAMLAVALSEPAPAQDSSAVETTAATPSTSVTVTVTVTGPVFWGTPTAAFTETAQ